MGRQIALKCAKCGYNARITDISADARRDVIKWSREYLDGRIEKGRMTKEETEKISEKFSVCNTLK